MILAGFLIKNNDLSQSLVVEFEYAGRFEVVFTHHEVSETFLCLGKKQVLISRNIGEEWGVSFFVQRLDYAPNPVFIYIKTLDDVTIFRTVLASHDSFLNIDCASICEIVNN